MSAVRFEDIDIQDLAPRLKELATVIGLPAASRLVKARGGTRIHIPREPEDTVLEPIVGRDALAQMIAFYGAGEMRLDRGALALKAAEDRAIVREYPRSSAAALALKWGRTERAIYKVIERAGKLEELQADLYR